MATKPLTAPITISVQTTYEVIVHEDPAHTDSRLLALLERFDTIHPLTISTGTPRVDHDCDEDSDSHATYFSSYRDDSSSSLSIFTNMTSPTSSTSSSSSLSLPIPPPMSRLYSPQLPPPAVLAGNSIGSNDSVSSVHDPTTSSLLTPPTPTPAPPLRTASINAPQTCSQAQCRHCCGLSSPYPNPALHIHPRPPATHEAAPTTNALHHPIRHAQTLQRKKSSCNLRNDFLSGMV